MIRENPESKAKKTPTKTLDKRKANSGKSVVSRRKNNTGSTRGEDRQRSGNNAPQPGSH